MKEIDMKWRFLFLWNELYPIYFSIWFHFFLKTRKWWKVFEFDFQNRGFHQKGRKEEKEKKLKERKPQRQKLNMITKKKKSSERKQWKIHGKEWRSYVSNCFDGIFVFFWRIKNIIFDLTDKNLCCLSQFLSIWWFSSDCFRWMENIKKTLSEGYFNLENTHSICHLLQWIITNIKFYSIQLKYNINTRHIENTRKEIKK